MSLDLALEWLSRGRPERALEELAGLPGDEGVSRMAYRIRASALHVLDRDREAVAIARQGLGVHGPDLSLLWTLGGALEALGLLQEAERAYLDALALDPEDVDVLCGYARLCASTGQLAKAERLIERAASHDPVASAVAAARVYLALAKGDDAEAARLSAEAMGRNPDDPGARTMHGVAAAYRGDMDAAYRSVRAAAADNPGDSSLVEAAYELRHATHWALRPLLPFQRFGPFKTWIGALVIIYGLRLAGLAPVALVFAVCWVLFCVYSWVVPPLVRRFARR